MHYLKTGILILALCMFSSSFVQASKVTDLQTAKLHLDPHKTYIVIAEDTILRSAKRAFSWRVSNGTVLEKIKTVYTTDKTNELWLVASLDKEHLGGRQTGVISLKSLREKHQLIEPSADASVGE